jgi:glycerate 2-kinase
MKKYKILLAPNSFKECSDSVEIASLLHKYLADPSFILTEKPLSDGGDGFLKVCINNFNLKVISYEITNCYPFPDEIISIGYKEGEAIFIESAEVIGLNKIKTENRNPLHYGSQRLGKLLSLIFDDYRNERINFKKIVIGVGGTAINDMGLGFCSELGLKIYNTEGKELPVLPINFHQAEKIQFNPPLFPFQFEIIVDVDSPLTGKKGASLTFGPQKGLSQADAVSLDKAFSNLLNILSYNKIQGSVNKLSGAGGGIAAAFQLFFNAEIKSADNFISDDLGLRELCSEADIIITGEGALDEQTLLNKAPGVILNLGKGKKIIIITGAADPKLKLDDNVTVIELQKFFQSKEDSIDKFEEGLKKASSLIKDSLL